MFFCLSICLIFCICVFICLFICCILPALTPLLPGPPPMATTQTKRPRLKAIARGMRTSSFSRVSASECPTSKWSVGGKRRHSFGIFWVGRLGNESPSLGICKASPPAGFCSRRFHSLFLDAIRPQTLNHPGPKENDCTIDSLYPRWKEGSCIMRSPNMNMEKQDANQTLRFGSTEAPGMPPSLSLSNSSSCVWTGLLTQL